MKDVYPAASTLPSEYLVGAAAQPDYTAAVAGAISESANVGELLSDRHVRSGRGADIAAICGETGEQLTFAQLAEESTRLAHSLVQLGVRPGDRVAYRSPNVPEVLSVMCGIWKAGGVMVPIPMQATAKDLEHYFEDTHPVFYFAHARCGTDFEIEASVAGSTIKQAFTFGDTPRSHRTIKGVIGAASSQAELPAVSSDAVAIIWHTGGTTGRPKSCYHTHRRFLYAGYALAKALGTERGERWTAAAPIGHALGIIYNTIFSLLHGATAVLVEHFQDPPVLLKAATNFKVTTLTALSATWAKALDCVERDPSLDLSSVRRAFAMWQSASSSDVYDRWKSKGIELLNNFGSTSFATWVIVPPAGHSSPRAALGRPAPGFQIAAIEKSDGIIRPLPQGQIGQLAVKGPTGLTYWNRPELQAKDVVDGWTLSDDLIRFDEAGNIHYLGRTDFMISSGGFKIAPVEVEDVLSHHPAVKEVAVVPGPCPIHLEMVVAYIALKPGYEKSDSLARELRDYAKSQLVSYKSPRRIEFIDALPRDGVGKVQSRIVKAWATGENDNSVTPV
jgi:2-aminobenzoate-CoA ligase